MTIYEYKLVRELFDYDAENGYFIRKSNNKIIDSLDSKGYIRVGIDYKRYRVHRVIWLWMTGEWPEHQVDHINGIRTDNRWSNLREATNAENHQNMKKSKACTSGYTGVTWHKQQKKWLAQIRVNGKTKYLGYHLTVEEAYSARLQGQKELFEFQPIPR